MHVTQRLQSRSEVPGEKRQVSSRPAEENILHPDRAHTAVKEGDSPRKDARSPAGHLARAPCALTFLGILEGAARPIEFMELLPTSCAVASGLVFPACTRYPCLVQAKRI